MAHPGHGGLGRGRVGAGQPDFQVFADANIGDGFVAQAAQAAEDGLALGGVDGGFEGHIDAGGEHKAGFLWRDARRWMRRWRIPPTV